jgi:hypothetical protein
MRLGQLARELEVKQEKIVSFLEKEKNTSIKLHPNSKVEDHLIEVITFHFKGEITPIQTEVKVEEKKEEDPTKLEKEVPQPPEQIVVEEKETIEKSIPTPQKLKIIGKIDLPNKKEVKVEVDGVVYDQQTLDTKKKGELKALKEQKALELEAKNKIAQEKKRIAKEKREVEAERQAMLKTEKHNLLTKEEERKKAIILKVQQERGEKLEKERKKRQKKTLQKPSSL